ncbi:alpha/beta fold hydrolase [Paenibacillus sp. SN-8-1]|uniref:alpha/beta fold hydrolase n=1 Tax=Paenibacillus sp. SN-8-1 TaxID=3435409 RepID=UPI003D9A952C
MESVNAKGWLEGTIILPDERVLAFTEYGDTSGIPIFVLHGTPGCRHLFEPDEPISRELGLRLISPDRPGMGRSSPKMQRGLEDWPDDMAKLADALGIEKFGVIGISGGGPYAAACAAKLASRLTFVTIIMTSTPSVWHRASKKMNHLNRVMFFLGRRAPGLLTLIFKAQARRSAKFPNSPGSSFYCEVYRQGVKGCVQDTSITARPWSFDPGVISVPVSLWHGIHDPITPIEGSRYLANRIKHAALYEVEGGHDLHTRTDIWRRILADAREKTLTHTSSYME